MERGSLVQDVEVEIDGEIHKATYFTEGSTIHAQIGEQTHILPMTAQTAEDTIRSLLAEKIRMKGSSSQTPHSNPEQLVPTKVGPKDPHPEDEEGKPRRKGLSRGEMELLDLMAVNDYTHDATGRRVGGVASPHLR